MIALIQLELPLVWWADTRLWNNNDDTPDYVDTVDRPTEDLATRSLHLQSRVIGRHGAMLKLAWSHLIVLRLERSCLKSESKAYIRNKDGYTYTANTGWIHEWIANRCQFTSHQVGALLDEAAAIIAVRDMLGLPQEEIAHTPIIIGRAA